MSLRTDFEVIIDLDIPDTQKLLLLVLLRYRNGVSGLCYPGIPLLMGKTGRQKTAVYEGLRELELAGYVTVEIRGGGKGRKTNYVLTLPHNAAGTSPGCAPVKTFRPGERFAESNGPPNGSANRSKPSAQAESQNNKELNTYELSLTRRHAPQSERRGKYARALENIRGG